MVDEEIAYPMRIMRRGTHPNKHMIRFAFRTISFIGVIAVFAFVSYMNTTNDEEEYFHRQLENAEDAEKSCPDLEKADTWYELVGLIFGVIYMFLGLALVCDEFFVPALEEMSGPNHLNLSMDIAGATLMAAGGSAPELFTSFIGTFKESDVGFGTIVGSAVFNVLFVIGMCSIFSKEVLSLTWWPLFRDSLYYLLGLTVLGCFLGWRTPGQVEYWESIVLFALYLGYVLVMSFNQKLQAFFSPSEKKDKSKQNDIYLKEEGKEGEEEPIPAKDEDTDLDDEDIPNTPPIISFRWPGGFRVGLVNFMTKSYRVIDATGANLVGKVKGDVNDVFNHIDKDGNDEVSKNELRSVLGELKLEMNDEEFEQLFSELDSDQSGQIDKAEFTKWYISSQQRMLKRVKETFDRLDKDNSNTLGRAEIKELLLSCSPNVKEVDITEALTNMYKSGDENEITYEEFEEWYKESVVYQKQQAATEDESQGIFASLKPPKECGIIALIRYILILPIIFLLAFTIPDVRRPGWGKWCYASFFLAICWIGLFSTFMAGWIEIIGNTVGIPVFIMGLTFAAAGTSIPDLLSSVIVARMGQGDMAVSSSIGSNIFDILVGLPLPWFFYSVIKSKNVTINATGVAIDIGILIAMILLIIATIHFSGWKLTKLAGGMMFFLYVVYLAIAIGRLLPFETCGG